MYLKIIVKKFKFTVEKQIFFKNNLFYSITVTSHAKLLATHSFSDNKHTKIFWKKKEKENLEHLFRDFSIIMKLDNTF